MLEFRPISLTDREPFSKIIEKENYGCSDWSFGSLFIWSDGMARKFALSDGMLFSRFYQRGKLTYSFPLCGGRYREAIARIQTDAASMHAPVRLSGIPHPVKEALEHTFPGQLIFTERRDLADYIYSSSSLISLSGKKLHSKRNFVNRFCHEYQGRFQWEPITSANAAEVADYHRHWRKKNLCDGGLTLEYETCSILKALSKFEEIGLVGMLVRIDGKVMAFTYGSRLDSNMFVVHAEKAEYEYTGLYPFINQTFVREMLSSYSLINREEDMGMEGLRKAKLSYHPVSLNLRWDAVFSAEAF